MAVCFGNLAADSQTTLNRGDLAIVAVNAAISGSSDEISFVCFKDITNGTEIQLTDNGYQSCVAVQWSGGEGGAIIKRTGGTIPKGTVITFRTAPFSFTYPDANWAVLDLSSTQLAGNLNMNSAGDQIYFAQGGTWTELTATCTITGPRTNPNAIFPGNAGRMLFGFSTSGSWVDFQMSSGESGLYPDMQCFSMAPTGSGAAFNKYTGPLTAATQTQWITRISTAGNWTTYSSSANYNSASPNYAVSNFTITINAGGDIPTAAWTAPTAALCASDASINLNNLVTGTAGGTWSGTGVTGNTFNPAGLNGNYDITYSVPYTSCSITQTSTITVISVAAPTVTSPVTYCQEAVAAPLTAVGTHLLWYTAATGGTGSNTAITPSTLTVGTTNYYVAETNGSCESVRSPITVITNSSATVNAVSSQTLCASKLTTAVSFSGSGTAIYNWTNDMPSIGLAASGTGNIPAFTALNTGTTPVIATITATPTAVGFAYVANYGIPLVPVAGTVSIINTSTNTVASSINVGTNPFGVAISPDGTRVYVTNYGSNTVSVINTATNTVISTIAVGSFPMGVAVSPDGTTAYVANQVSNNVSVISTSTNTVTATIPVSLQPQGICISPDGSKVYVANVNSNNVSVISTATNTVSNVVIVGSQPISLAITADGSRLYVTNFGTNNVSVINTSTNTVTSTIPVGTSPNGIAISPDGSKAYVTNQTSNNVSVIGISTNTVMATIAVGSQPQGVSFTSDGSKAYIANFGSGNVSVINTGTNTVTSTITVGTAPHSLGNFITQGSCSGKPINFTITVNPLPATPIASVTQQPTCDVPTGTINVSSPLGTGLTYSVNGVLFQSSPTFSGLTPGSYIVTVKNATGCTKTSSSVFISTGPTIPPTPIFVTTQPTCANNTGSITITFPTGAFYNYSVDGINYQPSPLFTNLAPNTYTVYVKNLVGGCTKSSTAIIGPSTALLAPAATITQPTCSNANGSITITSPIVVGLTYSIDGINFQSSTTFNNLAANTYTITVKSPAGCTNTSTAVLTATGGVAAPVATATQPTCATPTGTVTIISPTGTGLTYSIDGTNFQVGTSFTNLAPNSYTVTVKDASGCSNTGTVTVNPPSSAPAPILSTVPPTCTTSTGSITVTSPVGSGYNYSLDGTIFQTTTLFTNLSPSTYTVTVKDGNGCTNTGTATINAQPTVPVPTLTLTQPTCIQPTGSITIASPTGAIYTYSIDGINFQTGTSFTNLAPSNYSITAKNTSGCTATSSIATINTAPSIAAPSFTVTQPTCTAQGIISIASPVGTAYMYSIDGVNFQTGTSFTNLAPNSYTITVKNTDGCTANSSIATVNAAPSIPAPSFAVTQPTCTVATGSITIVSPTGTGYTYSIDGTNFQAGNIFTVLAPNTYTVTAKSADGCTSTATATVNNAPSFPVPTVAITQPTCTVALGSIVVTSPVGNAFTYSIDAINFQVSPNFTNLAPASYTLTVKNSTCSNVSSFTINPPSSPTAAPTVVSPITYCQNTVANALTANGSNLLWYASATGGIGSSTAPVPATSTSGTFHYYVSQTSGSCESPRADIAVQVDAMPATPIVVPNGNTSFCEGQDVPLTSSTATGYQWYKDGILLNGETNAGYTAAQTGSYTVSVTNAAGCSNVSAPTSITVYPNPIVSAGPDVLVYEGDSARLLGSATGGTTFSYLWSPPTYLSDNTIAQPWIVRPTMDGYYILDATNENGCTNSDMVFVKVLKDIIIPNAFSPNGDHINDTWDIPNLGPYPYCTVEVFARSGQLVYKSTGYSKAWDGRYNGKPLPVGVYYYIINTGNGKGLKSGSLTLLR